MSTYNDSGLERRIATALVERASTLDAPLASPQLSGDTQPRMLGVEAVTSRSRPRRRALVTAAAIVIAASAAVVATRRDTSPGDVRVIAPPTASSTSAGSTSQPTSTSIALSAAETSQRDRPLKAGAFPDTTGVVDPKNVQHHSGGPYVSPRHAVDIALRALGCTLGGSERGDANTGCLQADVRFFAQYVDWWRVEGGQTQFVGSWGPDREMYAVTIFGKIQLVTTAISAGSVYVPWRTFQIDATTGRVMMTGGLPLPERFPGVRSFRTQALASG